MDDGRVASVSAGPEHGCGKPVRDVIRLLEGLGVEGDAHLGRTVQHLSRLRRNGTRPNLRQVHLIGAELHDELRERGLDVGPGQMGENVTTAGIDLLALPAGTRLHIGPAAVVEVTGLRTPCVQLDGVRAGLLDAVRAQDAAGPRAGVMGVVVSGGDVAPGDAIRVVLPALPHAPLAPV